MKAQDLRIGNLILRQNKPYPISFDDFAKHGLELACDYKIKPHLEELEPIPLTEGWLLKMGFGKRFDDDTCNLWDFEHYKSTTVNGLNRGQGFMSLANFIEKYGWWLDLQSRTTLKYVHQLQNLYFAITGEELNIKL